MIIAWRSAGLQQVNLLLLSLTTTDVLGAHHLPHAWSQLSYDSTLLKHSHVCMTVFFGFHRLLQNREAHGDKTNQQWVNSSAPWRQLRRGNTIGMMLAFGQDGTATVTAYRDGVRAGVMSTGSLRGPLCPAVFFETPGQSVEFVPSYCPPSL